MRNVNTTTLHTIMSQELKNSIGLFLEEQYKENTANLSITLGKMENRARLYLEIFEELIKKNQIVNLKKTFYPEIYLKKLSGPGSKKHKYKNQIQIESGHAIKMPDMNWNELFLEDNESILEALTEHLTVAVIKITMAHVQQKYNLKPFEEKPQVPFTAVKDNTLMARARTIRTEPKKTLREKVQAKVESWSAARLAHAIDWLSNVRPLVVRFPRSTVSLQYAVEELRKRSFFKRLADLYLSLETFSSKLKRVLALLAIHAISNLMLVELLLPALIIHTSTLILFALVALAVNPIVFYIADEFLFYLVPHEYGEKDENSWQLAAPTLAKEIKSLLRSREANVFDWRALLLPIYYEKIGLSPAAEPLPSSEVLSERIIPAANGQDDWEIDFPENFTDINAWTQTYSSEHNTSKTR